MLFRVELRDVRPVKALTFSLDLDRNAPLCIVGRNGAGKTTLAKSIMNFALADTFRRTTSGGALRESSIVRYTVDDASFEFTYDPAVGTLSTRRPVPKSLRSLVAVELPIPHGQRFSYFHVLVEADPDIRRAIILDDDSRPDGMIRFLTNIYGDARFEDLREVKFSRGACCFYRVEEGRYVREDYFSSGEFFLVNLYRRLQSGARLIFIDEIDISLDAAAQARLVEELRSLCTEFSVNVVFTSHSLALMTAIKLAAEHVEPGRPTRHVSPTLARQAVEPAPNLAEEREVVGQHKKLCGRSGSLLQESKRAEHRVRIETGDGVVDDDDALRQIEVCCLQRLEEVEERDRRSLAIAQIRSWLATASDQISILFGLEFELVSTEIRGDLLVELLSRLAMLANLHIERVDPLPQLGEYVVARILVDVMDLKVPMRLPAHAARPVGSKDHPIGEFLGDSDSIFLHGSFKCTSIGRPYDTKPQHRSRPALSGGDSAGCCPAASRPGVSGEFCPPA